MQHAACSTTHTHTHGTGTHSYQLLPVPATATSYQPPAISYQLYVPVTSSLACGSRAPQEGIRSSQSAAIFLHKLFIFICHLPSTQLGASAPRQNKTKQRQREPLVIPFSLHVVHHATHHTLQAASNQHVNHLARRDAVSRRFSARNSGVPPPPESSAV
jgi:hypothetical protein